MSLNPNRREVLIGTAAIATVTTLPVLPDSPPPKMRGRMPLKLQQALDELSKRPSPRTFERGTLEEWEERNEGWIDRALSGAK